jgi:polar amino acid transport system substrate-binding protein
MSTATQVLIGALAAIAVIAVVAIVVVLVLNRSDEAEPTAVAPTTAAGVNAPALQNRVWQWERRAASDGSGEEVIINNPSAYTLAFSPDGSYQFQADCNRGSGTYTADDKGAIRMEAGPVTLAECGPESRYQDMLNMMGAVQDYQIEGNGEVLVMIWPAGGPRDYYRHQAVADDSWERVRAAGRMVVGTSADYPPFEYYGADGQFAGFDIALMDEIGRRLGVQVEYRDLAFDGLGSALMVKQIDAAIAAISVTPEREAEVDFSGVYLVSQDAILARQDAGIGIGSVDDLARFRVGVQRGSVYEDWLRGDLVGTGKMPEGNLLAYEKAEHAVRDLREGRADLVVLDDQPAQVFVAEGGVRVAAQGLNQQRFAIAFPKGAQALRAEIDRVVTALYNEGYIAQLASQYLNLDQLLPTPSPAVTSTPGPAPSCVDAMAFVESLTQGGDMLPGQAFVKGWRVVNSGTCTWDTGYRLVFVGGDKMGGEPVAVARQVAPGETYDIQVTLVAPLQPGAYQGLWQMENGRGQAFGERLTVSVFVPAAPTVTPVATQTPSPGITFTVDRTQIRAGECVSFYWKVENVKAVYFYPDGEDWRDRGVVGEGTRQECPPVTWTYNLRVVKPDDSVDVRQFMIYVEQAAAQPAIRRFTVDPPGQITLGQCVTIQWVVEGAVEMVSLKANDGVLWEPAPSSGSTQHCPDAAGSVVYGIVATGPGGSSQGSQTINVVGTATATPEPTLEPDQPIISAFAVIPQEIQAGESVGIRWSVSGGVAYSRIMRAAGVDPSTAVWEVVIDNAGFIGQAIDQLEEAGSYLYRLEVYNAAGDSVFEDQMVTVTAAE